MKRSETAPSPPSRARAIAGLVVTVALLGIFLFFSFAWNSVAADTINNKLRDAGIDVHVDGIQGAFPIDFEADTIDVYDFATLYGVRVRYGGTYNPFRATKQKGRVFRADATASVTLLHHQYEVGLQNVNFEMREEGGWRIWGTVVVSDVDVDVDMIIGAGEKDELKVKIPYLDVELEMSRTKFHVQYANHDVATIVVRKTEKQYEKLDVKFVYLLLGSVLNAHGFMVRSNKGSMHLRQIEYSLYDHPMHSVVEDIYLSRDMKTITTETSTQKEENGDSAAYQVREIKFDGRELMIVPPVQTIVGDLRGVLVDYSTREVVIDVGDVPITMNARNHAAGHPQLHVDYGPIHLSLHEETLHMQLRGGFYKSFKCIHADAHLNFDKPNLLVADIITAKMGKDTLHVEGTYDFDTETIDAKVNFKG